MNTLPKTPPFDPRDCKNTEEHLVQLRGLVSDLGWGEFMHHVAGVMAEQVEMVEDRQSSALFACSNTILALSSAFVDCGFFTKYPENMLPRRKV